MPKFKMKPKHYQQLEKMCKYHIASTGKTYTKRKVGSSYVCYVWDAYYAAMQDETNHPLHAELYTYLDDTNIETALKRIFKHV